MNAAGLSKDSRYIDMRRMLFLAFAILLSLSWTLPNHTEPWRAFHSDAWLSCVLLIVFFGVAITGAKRFQLNSSVIFFIFVAFIPSVHYLNGLSLSFGMTWVNSLHLFAVAFSVFFGFNWERDRPGEGLGFLFLAFFIASFVSVGMQIYQWFQLSYIWDLWLPTEEGTRFSANLRQPNQLGSLLMLGLASIAWGYSEKRLAAWLAALLAAFVLLGIALTQSRTAWLNVLLMASLFLFFWGDRKSRLFNFVIIGLAVYFVSLFWALPFLNTWFREADLAQRTVADPIRFAMWSNLILAAFDRPMLGYGWGQTFHAAIYRIYFYPDLASSTLQSHNIFIDLVLYAGFFFGGVVFFFTAWRISRFFGAAIKNRYIVPFSAMLSLVVHALLEYPLHYAYFLIPFSIFFGVLEFNCFRKKPEILYSLPTGVVFGVGFALALGLCLTIKEYFIVESTFHSSSRHYDSHGNRVLPDLYLLTQWRDRLEIIDLEPQVPLSEERRQFLLRTASTTPSPWASFKVAENLALAEDFDGAHRWLTVVCKISQDKAIEIIKEKWAESSEKYPILNNVRWAGCDKAPA